MIRRLLKYTVRVTTLLLLAAFTCIVILLYTEPGRIRLAETGITYAASGLDYDLRWAGIRSPEAGLWTVEELDLLANGTELVNISGIRLRWWPGTLLSGSLIIDEIRLDRIAVHDLDTLDTGPVEEVTAGIPVIVHSFSIGTLTLERSGSQELLQYGLYGDLELFNRGFLLTANTHIHPSNPQAFKLSLSTRVEPDGSGAVSGWYSEQPQGRAGTVLKLAPDEAFEASFHTEFSPVQAGFELNISDLAFVFHEHDVEIKGSLMRSGDVYTINRINIDIDSTRHVLSGMIEGDNMDLELILEGFPIEVLSVWTDLPLTGSGNGLMNITGTIDNPYIEGNITAGTTFRSSRVLIQLAGSADRQLISISEAVVTSMGNFRSEIDGDVDLTNKSINLRANLDNTSLNFLRKLEIDMPDGLEGNFNARAHLTGPVIGPEAGITGRFRGNYKGSTPISLDFSGEGKPFPRTGTTARNEPVVYDTTISQFELRIADHDASGRGHAMVSVSPMNIDIDGASIRIAGTTHHLAGKIDRDNIALDLDLVDLPLDILTPVTEIPLNGTASARLFIGGTFSDPLLKGSLNSTLEYRSVAMQLKADVEASDDRIAVNRVNIDSGKSSIAAQGVIDLTNDESNLNVNIDNLDMMTLHSIGIELPEDLTGLVNSDFTFRGSRKRPVLDGKADYEGTYRDVPVAMQLTARGGREGFEIKQLEINSGKEGLLQLQGNYDKQYSEFSLEARDMPSELLQYNGWKPPAGVLSADINASGNLNNPRAGGKLVFTRLIDTDIEGKLPSGIQADIDLAGNRLDVLLALAGEGARTGNIKVSLPWRRYVMEQRDYTSEAVPLYGTIKGEAWLRELCPLLLDTGIHQCDGKLQADLSLSNTIQSPHVAGSISISNGLYENIVTGTNLHDLNIDITANGRRADVISAVATDGENGTFKLTGGGNWETGTDEHVISLVLDVTDAHILRRFDMDGMANGNLNLTGDSRDLFLTGSLEISPFTLLLETFLQEDIPELNIHTGVNPDRALRATQREHGSLPVIHLDVGFAAEQQAYLRGPGLEAELQGRLSIQGTYKEPVYRGSFRTIRGSLHVLGKRFNINQGELRLENEVFSMIIPATYAGKDLEVRAELSGTEDDLKLSLSSTPAWPEDEIISRLLFGKSSQDISPLQAVRLANAITMFKRGGKPLFDPLGKIEKTLSVDRLTVEDSTDGNGLLLGVGKYIHEKVYVELETGTSAGETWQGNIEIELLPNLNLENSVNGKSGFGNMGLHWKKDY